MAKEIKIELNNKLSEVRRLSELLNEEPELIDTPEATLFALNLSLEEILTNVISYSYDDNEDHKIKVRIYINKKEVCVEVEDDGKPFNPLEAESPDITTPIEERQIGGLGIHLVKGFMDKLEYKRIGDRNLLILTKKSS